MYPPAGAPGAPGPEGGGVAPGRTPGIPGAPGGGGVAEPPPRAPRGGTTALLVAASAMSPAPPCEGGESCEPWTGLSAGDTCVRGNWLPPDISAVGASAETTGGGASSSSVPDSGGANTVAGSGTAASSESKELVSVPAHGVDPAGTPSLAVGS